MLLARVANCLYWIGRYIERAENANRHILIASEFAVELEGITEEIAVQEWQSLIHSMPTQADSAPSTGLTNHDSLRYMNSFLLDQSNPFSVVSSLGRARENARVVSETLTFEVTYSLNEAYRKLSSIKPSQVKDLGRAIELAGNTHNSIMTTLGAIDHTLTRGEAWDYMKFGEAIERTMRGLHVLQTRLPGLERWHNLTDTPLYYASWRSLLRSLAAQENYRFEHGPRFDRDQVVKFLLFHPTVPRSVFYSVRRMIELLDGMPDNSPASKEARRRLGKLASQLEFDQEEITRPSETHRFLAHAIQEQLYVHEAISNPMLQR